MRKPADYYHPLQRRGRVYSCILHALILLLAIFGLPNFFNSTPPDEVPIAITMEKLPISQKSNVKTATAAPKPTPEPPRTDIQPKPAVSEPPKPVEPKPEAKPVEDKAPPPPPTPIPKPPTPKPPAPPKPKSPETKPKPKPDPKSQEELFDEIIHGHKQSAVQQDTKPKSKGGDWKKAFSNNYDPSVPMSITEKDAIMSQIAKCWNIQAGGKDAETLVVTIDVEYAIDGTMRHAEYSNEAIAKMGSSNYRAAAESAMRAVKICSPLKDLPQDKFKTWQYMELRFDPKFMLN